MVLWEARSVRKVRLLLLRLWGDQHDAGHPRGVNNMLWFGWISKCL